MHKQLRCEVHAVDIHDNRQIFNHYKFTKVTDTNFPFYNHSFDVAISNHMIDKIQHLKEIYRILDQDREDYLVALNRWIPTEPDY